MTLPYLLKLLCLCLASFFLIHLTLALVIKLVTPAALRLAARIRPAVAARFLLFLRLLPCGFGLLIVTGLCVPSYLRLEPRTATSEEVGLMCLAFSILTAGLWGGSITRGLGALARSFRFLRHCQRNGHQADLPEERFSAWVVKEPATLFAIAGIIHPRLLISRKVMNALSSEQLAAAVRHERAHWTSRDNLKRLMLAMAPRMLPFLHGFGTLERSWARYTERAADDEAVAGDAARSLSLATALVSVSRLGIIPRPSALVAPLLADDDDLTARVERLLSSPQRAESHQSWMGCLVTGAALVLSGAVVALGLQPGLLFTVHRFLEHLIQ